jgi:uncharacterized protein YecT (DUF1311 family)
MQLARFLLVAVAVTAAASTSAASFDCARAARPVDKAICADPTLSQLDVDIAAAYAAAAAGLDDAMRARLKRSQREWLSHREAGRQELAKGMKERLSLLRSTRRTLGGVAFLELTADRSRPMFMLSAQPGASAYNRWADSVWEQDGGEYTVSEGDREQAKCDAEAKVKPADAEDCFIEGDQHSFETVVLPPGVVSVSEWLSRDQHVAHPIEERHHTAWWLRRSGRVGAADMFKGEAYQDVIARSVRAGVHERCGDIVPPQAAIDSVIDPDAWGLLPDGMGLAGDGYTFGCGRGPVDVDVPWRDLRAVMRPEFAAAIGLR